MTEPQPRTVVDRDDMTGDGFRRRRVEAIRVETARRLQDAMVDRKPGDRNRGRDRTRVGAQAFDAQHHEIAQSGGQRRRTARGRQLLGEERVPATAPVHRVEQRPIGRRAQHLAHQQPGRVAVEAFELAAA